MSAENLLSTLRTFVRKSNIPETRIGRDAVNDPRFVRDVLVLGRTPRPTTAARVLA